MPKKNADKLHYSNNRNNRRSNMQTHYKKCKSQVLLHRQCAYYRSAQAKTAAKLLQRARKCKYAKTTGKQNLSLHEPNQLTREFYVKLMKYTISRDASLRKELVVAFRASNNYSASNIKASKLANAVSHIAVRKFLCKILKLRKLCVGEFLMSVRKVNNLQSTADDFGQCFHTASSEPFFYEESYYHHIDQCSQTVNVPAVFKVQVLKLRSDRTDMITRFENQIGDMNCCHCTERTTPIVIDENGSCKIAEEIGKQNPKTKQSLKWKCTHHCKLPNTEQRQHIIDLQALFKEQVRKLRQGLNRVDSGCHNNHYKGALTGRELAGHPPSCIWV